LTDSIQEKKIKMNTEEFEIAQIIDQIAINFSGETEVGDLRIIYPHEENLNNGDLVSRECIEVKVCLKAGYDKARYIRLVELFGRLNICLRWLKEHGRVEQKISSFHRPGEVELILRAGYKNFHEIFNKIIKNTKPCQGAPEPGSEKKVWIYFMS